MEAESMEAESAILRSVVIYQSPGINNYLKTKESSGPFVPRALFGFIGLAFAGTNFSPHHSTKKLLCCSILSD